MIYEKIQELKRNKLNKSQVSRRLGIDYKTVLKYWDMKPDGFAKARDQAKERAKKADKYRNIVLESLRKYPVMTAAQIYDRIKEVILFKQEDGSYKRVAVKTGLSDGVNIEIKEGLSAGDVVRGPKIVSE